MTWLFIGELAQMNDTDLEKESVKYLPLSFGVYSPHFST